MRLRLGLALALAVGPGFIVAASSSPAQARGETDPLVKLRTTDAELRAAVNRRIPEWSPEASSRQVHIDRLLHGLLDYEVIARRALGEETYAALSPAKRREFVAAFAAVTGQTFLARMQEQQTRTRYDSETINGTQARVSARGIRGDSQAEIEYVLEQRDNEWLVTDVVIDGQSLVAGYQEQFRRVIAREGVDGLLERMRNRLSPDGN